MSMSFSITLLPLPLEGTCFGAVRVVIPSCILPAWIFSRFMEACRELNVINISGDSEEPSWGPRSLWPCVQERQWCRRGRCEEVVPSVLLSALHQEIRLLSLAAMPFMPSNRMAMSAARREFCSLHGTVAVLAQPRVPKSLLPCPNKMTQHCAPTK